MILASLRPDRSDSLLIDWLIDWLIFRYSAAPRPNFSPITGIRVMISEIAFDRLGRLRLSPHDLFKFRHDRPNPARPDITQFYPLNRSRSSQSSDSFCDHPGNACLHIIFPIAWTLFETTGTIETIWMMMITSFFKGAPSTSVHCGRALHRNHLL